MDGHGPLLRDILIGQIEQFARSLWCGKRGFCLDDLAHASIVAFNGIRRIDQPANFGWVIKEGGQIFPVVLPRLAGNGVLLPPRFAQLQEVRVLA